MKKFKIQNKLVLIAGALLLAATLLSEPTKAQNKLPYDTTYTFAHYKVRRAFYEGLPNRKNEIVFLGNSITEKGDWNELFQNKRIINRGIGGDVCFGLLNRLNEVVSSKPKSIFLMIGINDIGRGVPEDVIAGKIQEIITTIKQKSPKTRVFLQSVLPINEKIIWYDYMKNKSDQIAKLNEKLKMVAKKEGIPYLDLYSKFADKNGQLLPHLTADGIHLSAAGYLEWRKVFQEEGIKL
uniref:GDSL-type esterase/lipase family protein n=1 Tax=uncultured Draconibacterium sp. TaxID=1573823 RepID=UPI003216354B